MSFRSNNRVSPNPPNPNDVGWGERSLAKSNSVSHLIAEHILFPPPGKPPQPRPSSQGRGSRGSSGRLKSPPHEQPSSEADSYDIFGAVSTTAHETGLTAGGDTNPRPEHEGEIDGFVITPDPGTDDEHEGGAAASSEAATPSMSPKNVKPTADMHGAAAQNDHQPSELAVQEDTAVFDSLYGSRPPDEHQVEPAGIGTSNERMELTMSEPTTELETVPSGASDEQPAHADSSKEEPQNTTESSGILTPDDSNVQVPASPTAMNNASADDMRFHLLSDTSFSDQKNNLLRGSMSPVRDSEMMFDDETIAEQSETGKAGDVADVHVADGPSHEPAEAHDIIVTVSPAQFPVGDRVILAADSPILAASNAAAFVFAKHADSLVDAEHEVGNETRIAVTPVPSPTYMPLPPEEANRLVWPKEKLSSEAVMLKAAIEAIMDRKVKHRKKTADLFRWEIAGLVIYCIFLILLTARLLITDTSGINRAKSAAENMILESHGSEGAMSLNQVSTVNDIYTYLALVLIPAVTVQKMTLPPSLCLNSSSCVSTRKGFFENGANQLFTSVRVRQLRVRRQPRADILYPQFSDNVEESRDGGGTLIDHDPQYKFPDWPNTRIWYKYNACVESKKDHCFVDDGRALRRGKYKAGGYSAELYGSYDVMTAITKELQQYQFFSLEQTRAVFVELAASLSWEQLVCSITILFEVTQEGHVVPSYIIRIANLRQSTDAVWEGVLYAIFGVILVLIIMDALKIIESPRAYITSVWNLISWLMYAAVVASAGLKGFSRDDEVLVKNTAPPGTSAVSALPEFPLWEILHREDLFQQIMAFVVFFAWVRFIKYLEPVSSITRQMVGAIERASPVFFFLAILFSCTYIGSAVAFLTAFGRSMQHYSSLPNSLSSLIGWMIGQADYRSVIEDGRDVGPLLAAMMLVVWVFLAVMFIASAVESVLSEKDHWTKTGSQELTLDRTLRALMKKTSSLFRANTLDELTLELDEAERAHLAPDMQSVISGEYLTRREFLILFRKDVDALKRMGVRSVDELLQYINATGDERLPMQEVRAFREELHVALQEKELLEEEIRKAVEPKLDADAVQAVVEQVFKLQLSETVAPLIEAIEKMNEAGSQLRAGPGRGHRRGVHGSRVPLSPPPVSHQGSKRSPGVPSPLNVSGKFLASPVSGPLSANRATPSIRH